MSHDFFPLKLHSSHLNLSLPCPQNPAEVPRRLHSQERGLIWGLGYFSKLKARGSGNHPLVELRCLVTARANQTVWVKEGPQLRIPRPAVQSHSRPVTGSKAAQTPGMGEQPKSGSEWKLLGFDFLCFSLMAMLYGNIVDLPFDACHQYTACKVHCGEC